MLNTFSNQGNINLNNRLFFTHQPSKTHPGIIGITKTVPLSDEYISWFQVLGKAMWQYILK